MCPAASRHAAISIQGFRSHAEPVRNAATGTSAIGTGMPQTGPKSAAGERRHAERLAATLDEDKSRRNRRIRQSQVGRIPDEQQARQDKGQAERESESGESHVTEHIDPRKGGRLETAG